MTITEKTEFITFVGFVTILGALVMSALYSFSYKTETSSTQTTDKAQMVKVGVYEQAVLNAQDAFRKEKGLTSLVLNEKLTEAAKNKAELLCSTGVWAHAPKEGRVWEQEIIESGYEYDFAGENLAKGYDEPEGVIEAWITSPTHKANLVGDYKDIGVAFNECDGKQFTVMEYGR